MGQIYAQILNPLKENKCHTIEDRLVQKPRQRLKMKVSKDQNDNA